MTAKVQNGRGDVLSGVTVVFTATVGTLADTSAATDPKGIATTAITATEPAKITATAGSVTAQTIVALQAPITTPTTPTPPEPPPPPPGPPPPGPLTVTLLVTPAQAGSATTFSLASPGITRAVWIFGDGASTTTTAPTTSHIYAAAGTYTASVTITDTIGRTASDSETVTIPAPPPPPGPSYTVTLAANPSTVIVNETSTLTATATPVNGAGQPESYAWDCNGDGTTDFTTTTNSQTCRYTTVSAPGVPTVSRVTVTGGAASGTASVNVTVTAGAPLAAQVTAVPSGTLTIGQPVTFTATLSSTGPVPTSGLTWEWDFDGDSTIDVVSAAHGNPDGQTTTYGSAGVKTLKVKATDTATGRTANGTRTVTVVEP